MRRCALGRILAWAVIGATFLVPPPASAQVGRTEIASVRFHGNQLFPDDSLARAIVTRESECRSAVLSPFCVFGADFAVQRFYLNDSQIPIDGNRLVAWYRVRGFREAIIEPPVVDTLDGRAHVSFTVVEGLPVVVDSIGVLGVEGLGGEGLLEDLPLQLGDRMSLYALDATRDALERRLQNRGYAYAEVLIRSMLPADAPYSSAVTFDVDLGPLSEYGLITIANNQNLSESTILRTAQIQTGRLFRRDQLLESQTRLFGLDIVSSARVEPFDIPIAEWELRRRDLSASPDSVIPVTLRVQEGDQYRLRYGAGWSTAECLDVESRGTARNFAGGGRILQLRGRVANLLAADFHDVLCPSSGSGSFAELNWLAALDFAQPWIFSTRNSFVASVFSERQSLPDVFVRRAVGLDLALTRAIGPQTPLTISYRPELSRLDAADVLFCTGFLVCTPDDIEILESSNWLAPLGINFTRLLANNPLNPTRGYNLVVDIEHAAFWTGSNFRYDRVVAEGTWYASQGSGVLAARVRGGWVGAGPFSEFVGAGVGVDVVHPQKRFYAGGANSVRGFAQSRLGPRVLTVDPNQLLDERSKGGACTPEQVIELSCDAMGLQEGRFMPRPTGGTRVLEANLEVRFRLGSRLQGVTFVDAGQLWGATEAVDLGDLEVTPGAGVRFLSPIGPLRVDVAYRFRGGEALSVVTSQLRPFADGQDELEDQILVGGERLPFVRSNELAVLGPRVLFGESSALSLRRFQLHIAIGQAF